MDHQEKMLLFQRSPSMHLYDRLQWLQRKIIVFRVNNALLPPKSQSLYLNDYSWVLWEPLNLSLAIPNIKMCNVSKTLFMSHLPRNSPLPPTLCWNSQANPQNIFISLHTWRVFSDTYSYLQHYSFEKMSSKSPVKWHVNTFLPVLRGYMGRDKGIKMRSEWA